jgi:hypothetical protein
MKTFFKRLVIGAMVVLSAWFLVSALQFFSKRDKRIFENREQEYAVQELGVDDSNRSIGTYEIVNKEGGK